MFGKYYIAILAFATYAAAQAGTDFEYLLLIDRIHVSWPNFGRAQVCEFMHQLQKQGQIRKECKETSILHIFAQLLNNYFSRYLAKKIDTL